MPTFVAVRVWMEAALPLETLEVSLHQAADRQYERELLFSNCVDLMGLVV